MQYLCWERNPRSIVTPHERTRGVADEFQTGPKEWEVDALVTSTRGLWADMKNYSMS